MCYKYSLLLIGFLSIAAYSQNNDLASNDPVELVLSSEKNVKKVADFNPNGVRLTPDDNQEFLLLEFKEKVDDLAIEIIDLRGRVISQFRGDQVASINFDTKGFYQGKYFVRIKSDTIKDFLKFEIK